MVFQEDPQSQEVLSLNGRGSCFGPCVPVRCVRDPLPIATPGGRGLENRRSYEKGVRRRREAGKAVSSSLGVE